MSEEKLVAAEAAAETAAEAAMEVQTPMVDQSQPPTTESKEQAPGTATPGQAAVAVEAVQLRDKLKDPAFDVMSLSPQERVNYILDIRRRIQADPTSVTDDEIRNSVRLIRISRSDAGRSRKSGKTPKPVVALSDF